MNEYVIIDKSHTDKKVYLVNLCSFSEETSLESIFASLYGAKKFVDEFDKKDFLDEDDYLEIIVCDLKD